MTDRRITGYVYFRTIIVLTISTIFVFSVLCFVYYQRMSSSLITEKTELLKSTTQNAAAGLEKLLADNNDVTASDHATLNKVYLYAISVSNKVSVWIVESDGRISYYSDIPNEAASQLIIQG